MKAGDFHGAVPVCIHSANSLVPILTLGSAHSSPYSSGLLSLFHFPFCLHRRICSPARGSHVNTVYECAESYLFNIVKWVGGGLKPFEIRGAPGHRAAVTGLLMKPLAAREGDKIRLHRTAPSMCGEAGVLHFFCLSHALCMWHYANKKTP